ncbi:hypothetical protein B0A53_01974 [Rhodotorula sp. CCFEE 5036]|nr:hypothetical protein B0A53_01974 [Rhodotorula sp. CCFEE 5036]
MPGLKPARTSASKRKTSPSKAEKSTANSSSSSPAKATQNKDRQEEDGAKEEEERNELLQLAESVAQNAHLLVRGRGDEQLAQLARNVLKRSFDQAVESESLAFPHLSALLASLSPASGPSTRSRTAAAPPSLDEDEDESQVKIEPTPIPELTVDGGMDNEMIWEQMELRGKTVDGLMEAMFGQKDEDDEEGASDEGDEEGAEEGFEGLEEDGGMYGESDEEDQEEEDEEVDFDDIPEAEKEEYCRKLGGGDDDDDDEEDDEAAEPDAAADPLADESSALTLDNFDGESGRKSKSWRSKPSGPPSAVDDQFFSLADFHRDADAGEYEMNKMLRGEDLSDDDEFDGDRDDFDGGGDGGGIDLFAPVDGLGGGDDDDDEEGSDEEEGDLDVGGVMYRDFFDPPPAARGAADHKAGKGKGKGKTGGKAASPSKPAALPAASKEDDDGADVAEPPAKKAKRRGVRFSDAVKVKEIPHRLAEKKRLMALAAEDGIDEETLEERLEELVAGSDEDDDDDEEEDEEMEEGSSFGGDDAGAMDLDGFGDEEMEQPGSDDAGEEAEEAEDGEDEDEIAEGAETIDRFKSELFEDEPEEDEKTKNLSRHERRLLQLSSQIASLEQENVGPKDWATMGEAQSRDRPVNSLLEEDLDFERMGKVAPAVTEETTRTIEDLIKQRILAHQFDDVERRVAVDPNQFLPSRYIELQDTKSQKSLAEVYEDEYRDQREREQGNEVVQELDKDLMKRHDEIEALFEDLAARLDALSNAHFTPKAPKPSITTVSNLPSISVESALPTTHSTSTLLAPEEVYSAKTDAARPNGALAIDAADLTPAQKKAQRQKSRQERKARAEKAERILAARDRKKGVRGEKDAAERKLVGVKGVTVIGKGGKAKDLEAGGSKKRKRGDGEAQPTSVGLKL